MKLKIFVICVDGAEPLLCRLVVICGSVSAEELKINSLSILYIASVFRDHLIHHISLFYPLALQERYEKEARKSPTASEGHGDHLESQALTTLSPMPLAEVELKWEMEKEEKKLLWEQLQGLEVNLGFLELDY